MTLITPGDILICRDRAPKMRTTVGREYPVLWVRGQNSDYPTIANDDGRPTQYHRRWFERKESEAT